MGCDRAGGTSSTLPAGRSASSFKRPERRLRTAPGGAATTGGQFPPARPTARDSPAIVGFMADGQLILPASALLAGGLMASFLAGRLRVPSLVVFLGIGMLVGSDALG